MWRRIKVQTVALGKDEIFLGWLKVLEKLVAKILSLIIAVVICVAVFDLGIIIAKELFTPPSSFLGKTLINIFGLFLNILIALEILENITAYLKECGSS